MAAQVGGQPDAGIRHVLQFAPSLVQRRYTLQPLDREADLIGVPRLRALIHIRWNCAGTDGMAADVTAQFQCHHLHEGDLPRFGGSSRSRSR